MIFNNNFKGKSIANKPVFIIASKAFGTEFITFMSETNLYFFPKDDNNFKEEPFKQLLLKVRRDMGLFPKTYLPAGIQKFDTSQQELFLSIFLQNEMAFEIDDLSEKLNLIHSLDEKFNREIDKAILRHLQGKLFKNDTPANRPKRSNIRTICMLLGLKLYYESYSDAFWPNIPKDKVSFVDESGKDWTLSYPLLLIQIINFSQWE